MFPPKRRSRSPYKPRKKSPSKLRRDSRRTTAIQKLLGSAPNYSSPEKFDAASDFLRSSAQFEPASVLKLSEILVQTLRRKVASQLVRVSRKDYLRALDHAYAVAMFIAGAPQTERATLLDDLCREAELKFTASTNLMSLAARAVIDYGRAGGKPNPESRRLWSRDANALLYLHSQGVRPGGISEFRKKNGGGVEAWAEAWSKRKRGLSARAPAQKPTTKAPSTVDHWTPKSATALSPVLKHMEDSGKAVLLVRKVGSRIEFIDVAEVQLEIGDPKKSKFWKRVRDAAAANGPGAATSRSAGASGKKEISKAEHNSYLKKKLLPQLRGVLDR